MLSCGILLKLHGIPPAALAGLFTAVIRKSLGTGTIFAFPGSIFGEACGGGLLLQVLQRDEEAAFAEPLGTTLIGGVLSGLVFAPAIGTTGSTWYFLYISLP